MPGTSAVAKSILPVREIAIAVGLSSLIASLILVVPSSHVSFLVLGSAAVLLLIVRPTIYILAMWCLFSAAGVLMETLTSVQMDLWGMTINPFGLLNGLLPLVCTATLLRFPQRLENIPLRVPLFSIAGWATISLIGSGFPPLGIRQWIVLLNWISAYLMYACFPARRTSIWWTERFMAMVALASALGVVFASMSGIGHLDYGRQQAFNDEIVVRATGQSSQQPEGTGQFLAIAAVVSLAFAVGPLRRRPATWLFAVLCAGTWLTFARGAALALLVACLFMLWQSRGLNWKTGLLAVGSALALVIANPRFDWGNAHRGIINEIVYANAVWRIDTWLEVMRDLSVQGLVLGKGIGSTFDLIGGSPHNEYVLYIHDYGLIGLALLLALMISVYVYARKVYLTSVAPLARTWALACMAMVVADAVIKCVDTPFNAASTNYTYALVVAMTCITATMEESGADSPEAEGMTCAASSR